MQNLKFLKKFTKDFLRVNLKSKISPKIKPYADIGILNPGIGTLNLGDLIIYESVYRELRNLFPEGLFTDFPTQIHTSFDARDLMRQKDLLFISGTNLLSSNMETRHQWKIHRGHKKFLKNKVVLFGCGWWQYQDEINKYTKDLYTSVFNQEVLHSARDQYTVDKLKTIGIDNVVNTTCPTLWSITPEKCNLIPKTKGEEVVTTLTFYHKDAKLDHRMLEILSQNYNTVYLWIQGMDDVHYYNEINTGWANIELLPPTMEAFDKILLKPNIDYLGTRLHAGVRSLQNNVRTLILAVDNRAMEIGKDVNLNVIKRENVEDALEFINKDYTTEINLPQENIDRWRSSLNPNN